MEAPAGYTKDTSKSVTVTAQNDVSNAAKLSMQDYALTLTFDKTDGLTDKPLDGCTFVLKDSEGETVPLIKVKNGVYKPDADGEAAFTTYEGSASITQIQPGQYTICEETPAEGYTKAADIAVTVSQTHIAASPAAAGMKNGVTAISLNKVDAQSGSPIGGAVFRLLDEAGEPVTLSTIAGKPGWMRPDRGGSETFTIPETGLTLAYLPRGEYELAEASPAPGYAPPAENVSLSVTDSTTTAAPGKATLSNEPLAVEVTKTDALNGAPLPGVQFLLFTKTAEGVYRVDPDGAALFQTGPDGKATLLAVPTGDYTLAETGNTGFGKVEPVPFTVTEQNTSQTPVAIGVENQPLALEVYKVDKESQVPLGGVPFKLFNGEGAPLCFALGEDGIYRVSTEGDAIFLTDDTGKATLLYVPEGILTLEEQLYSGYGVAAPVSVTISEENILALPKVVTVENEPLAVEIYKEDAFTGAPMAASFTLLDGTGKTIPLARMSDGAYRPADTVSEAAKAEERDEADGTQAAPTLVEKVNALTLDAKTGKARIEYLTEGTYQLVEDPVPGYIALSGIEFTLQNRHTKTLPLQCTVSNLPTRFLLEKQDGVTKRPLQGAKFKLTDEEGAVIKLIQQKDGTYRPAQEGETGVEVLELTNEKAQAVICYLPAGKVTATEVEGPAGYSIAPPITTEVGTETVLHTAVQAQKEDATASPLAETSLAVVDLPLALKISKVHSKTHKPLPGAGFQLKSESALSTPLTFTLRDGVYWYDPDGSVTTIEAAGDTCEALLYGLPAGKYQLEETWKPPAKPQGKWWSPTPPR